jgi:hypothetical protein
MGLKRFALSALALAVITGGCGGASHLRALQPQPPKVSPSPKATVPLKDMRLGLDVDWYTYADEPVAAMAAQTVSYAQSLHANALAISFPFFMDGVTSWTAHGDESTPTPAELGILITDAQEAGLTVSLRPLMDTGSVGMSRVFWHPSHPREFFAAYRAFLRPYLELAQQDGVAQFIEATEMNEFQNSPLWAHFTDWAESIYKGQIACAANWSAVDPHLCGGHVTMTVDAYKGEPASRLLTGWEKWDAQLPAGTTLSEVDIAAAPQAYRYPWRNSWHISAPDPEVQARWFSAACSAAAQEGLGGIYFWAIPLGTPTPGPTLATQLRWSGSAGAAAISSCFEAIAKGSIPQPVQ